MESIMEEALIRDYPITLELPHHFRSYLNLNYSKLEGKCNTKGLDRLRCLASGQFSSCQFAEAVFDLNLPSVYVFDLRMESHFLFDSKPYSWYRFENTANLGKCTKQILNDEQTRTTNYQKAEQAEYYTEDEIENNLIKISTPTDILFDTSETENDLVTSAQCNYIRLPIQDHCRPTDLIVQEFINLIQKLPEETIFYLHCKGGDGRTTTALVMLDILKNPEISLGDIIQRHAVIGPDNLKDFGHHTGVKAKRTLEAIQRYEFLELFHKYVSTGEINNCTWCQFITNNKEPQSINFAFKADTAKKETTSPDISNSNNTAKP
jgi:hypothetical protein